MNRLRIAISAFVVVLLTIVALGWRWTTNHQPPGLALASHIVLALAAAGGVFALVKIWQSNPQPGRRQ
jgi:membrane protein YdbS with pleckstrin-like domain